MTPEAQAGPIGDLQWAHSTRHNGRNHPTSSRDHISNSREGLSLRA